MWQPLCSPPKNNSLDRKPSKRDLTTVIRMWKCRTTDGFWWGCWRGRAQFSLRGWPPRVWSWSGWYMGNTNWTCFVFLLLWGDSHKAGDEVESSGEWGCSGFMMWNFQIINKNIIEKRRVNWTQKWRWPLLSAEVHFLNKDLHSTLLHTQCPKLRLQGTFTSYRVFLN